MPFQGVNVLIEIGADVNFGESGEIPLRVAVKSRSKKMVECLLEHDITNVNVQEALKLSWELKLDSITGLLLESIAVDRSRDSVNLSGLELATVKPLWILPSLGVKTLPEDRQQHRQHRKQRSLGHVKDFLVHRKSIATDIPYEMEGFAASLVDHSKKPSRRQSVDISSLKYVVDVEASSDNKDDIDFGGQIIVKQNLGDIDESTVCIGNSQAESSMSCHLTGDSGVETADTVLWKPSTRKHGLLEPQERSLSKRGRDTSTVSGAATLPHCTKLALNRNEDESLTETSTVSSHYPDGDSILSPAHLIRKLRNRHKKNARRRFSGSFGSSVGFQAGSQMPAMYFADDGVQDSTTTLSPLHSLNNENEQHSAAESVSPSFVSPSNQSSSSGILSPNSSSGDDVDFGGYIMPVPEYSSQTQELNTHHVKMLDLSSNQLVNFNDLHQEAYGGELVFKRLKDVSSLDLKQNRLSELIKPMMKVRPYVYVSSLVAVLLEGLVISG